MYIYNGASQIDRYTFSYIEELKIHSIRNTNCDAENLINY